MRRLASQSRLLRRSGLRNFGYRDATRDEVSARGPANERAPVTRPSDVKPGNILHYPRGRDEGMNTSFNTDSGANTTFNRNSDPTNTSTTSARSTSWAPESRDYSDFERTNTSGSGRRNLEAWEKDALSGTVRAATKAAAFGSAAASAVGRAAEGAADSVRGAWDKAKTLGKEEMADLRDGWHGQRGGEDFREFRGRDSSLIGSKHTTGWSSDLGHWEEEGGAVRDGPQTRHVVGETRWSAGTTGTGGMSIGSNHGYGATHHSVRGARSPSSEAEHQYEAQGQMRVPRSVGQLGVMGNQVSGQPQPTRGSSQGSQRDRYAPTDPERSIYGQERYDGRAAYAADHRQSYSDLRPARREDDNHRHRLDAGSERIPSGDWRAGGVGAMDTDGEAGGDRCVNSKAYGASDDRGPVNAAGRNMIRSQSPSGGRELHEGPMGEFEWRDGSKSSYSSAPGQDYTSGYGRSKTPRHSTGYGHHNEDVDPGSSKAHWTAPQDMSNTSAQSIRSPYGETPYSAASYSNQFASSSQRNTEYGGRDSSAARGETRDRDRDQDRRYQWSERGQPDEWGHRDQRDQYSPTTTTGRGGRSSSAQGSAQYSSERGRSGSERRQGELNQDRSQWERRERQGELNQDRSQWERRERERSGWERPGPEIQHQSAGDEASGRVTSAVSDVGEHDGTYGGARITGEFGGQHLSRSAQERRIMEQNSQRASSSRGGGEDSRAPPTEAWNRKAFDTRDLDTPRSGRFFGTIDPTTDATKPQHGPRNTWETSLRRDGTPMRPLGAKSGGLDEIAAESVDSYGKFAHSGAGDDIRNGNLVHGDESQGRDWKSPSVRMRQEGERRAFNATMGTGNAAVSERDDHGGHGQAETKWTGGETFRSGSSGGYPGFRDVKVDTTKQTDAQNISSQSPSSTLGSDKSGDKSMTGQKSPTGSENYREIDEQVDGRRVRGWIKRAGGSLKDSEGRPRGNWSSESVALWNHPEEDTEGKSGEEKGTLSKTASWARGAVDKMTKSVRGIDEAEAPEKPHNLWKGKDKTETANR